MVAAGEVTEENDAKVLTKTAYEHLVAVAVGQILKEGKTVGPPLDKSKTSEQ